MKIPVCCVLFLVFLSCATSRNMGQIIGDEPTQVKIKKTENIDGFLYIYGIVGKDKVRIISEPRYDLKKNEINNVELTSLRALLIQHNLIPVNYLDVDLSNVALSLNDSSFVKLEHKKYKDIFLTPEIKNTILDVLHNMPISQR